MRHALVLAAILAFGVPACAQQARQPNVSVAVPLNPSDKEPHVGPIPTNPSDWHLYLEPIPTNPAGPVYAEPIPNWPNVHEFEVRSFASSVALQPCAIFQPAGKKYKYFDGSLPEGIKRKRRFTDADLQRIKEKGGNFRIVKPGSSKSEMETALDACFMSTAKRLP
jgi:hypothetical protein